MTPQFTEEQLDQYEERLDQAMKEAKIALERRQKGEIVEDFDIRGKLYGIAIELGDQSRHEDIEIMQKWIEPKKGEVVLELASGTGFLTRHLSKWTEASVYATDPAQDQIDAINSMNISHVQTVLCSPDNKAQMDKVPEKVDIVCAFGGIHHVPQFRPMMENVANALKPGGRFIACEVMTGSPLARHFDEFVAVKSITGHIAQWYDDEVLKKLVEGLPLKIVKTEYVTLKWYFDSERHMALFMKGLHGHDVSLEEENADLQEVLGWKHENGGVVLNWPMYLFHIDKTE